MTDVSFYVKPKEKALKIFFELKEEKMDKKISCGKGNFHKKEVKQNENYEKKRDKYNEKTGFQNVNIQNEK